MMAARKHKRHKEKDLFLRFFVHLCGHSICLGVDFRCSAVCRLLEIAGRKSSTGEGCGEVLQVVDDDVNYL
jgi:hypothetical protein